MRLPLLALALLSLVPFTGAQAAAATSALEALKLLPKPDAKRLAHIEGRDGTPTPERWHVLVHDPTDANGLHEYVVAHGEIVASRSLSQFAETIRPEDVIGAEAIKIDSDRAERIAQRYAAANRVSIASYHLQARKASDDGAPLWSVICVDPNGRRLGELLISAATGSVRSHDGFAVEPPPAATPTPAPVEKERPKTQVAVRDAAIPRERRAAKPIPRAMPVATPEPAPISEAPAEPEQRGTVDRIGSSLQRIFGRRNPVER